MEAISNWSNWLDHGWDFVRIINFQWDSLSSEALKLNLSEVFSRSLELVVYVKFKKIFAFF